MKTFSGKPTCELCGNIIQGEACLYCHKQKDQVSTKYNHPSHREFKKKAYEFGSDEVQANEMDKIRQMLGISARDGVKVDRRSIQEEGERKCREGQI